MNMLFRDVERWRCVGRWMDGGRVEKEETDTDMDTRMYLFLAVFLGV
jgi:hypothetical protein